MRSLVIPLDGMALVVPNALISEVATLGEMTPATGTEEWLIGSIQWRGLRVPLVSYERVLGNARALPGRNSRAIVFNTLNGNRELPFVAVLSQRIPRLLLVTARMLQRVDEDKPHDAVLARLELQGDEVLVPDVDRLEQMLIRQGARVERVIG